MKTRMYLSECGKYICRAVAGVANYEAWKIDGAIHWPLDRGWSSEKTGQKPGSFTLTLGPSRVEVVFRRKIQANHQSAWLRRIKEAV